MTARTIRTGADVIRCTVARNRRAIAIGTLLLCVHQLAETSVAVLIGVLIDTGVSPGQVAGIVASIIALAGIFLVLTASYRAGMRRLNEALQNESHLLRLEVSEKALSPRGMRSELTPGELVTISGSDADQAAWFLDLLPRMIAAATAVVATAIALLLVDTTLGALALIAMPVFFALAHGATPRITAKAVRQRSRVAEATALAGDLLSGSRSIAGLGAEDAAARRYRVASRVALSAAMSTNRSIAFQRGVTAAMSGVAAAVIASVAGWYALTGRITTGELITVVGLAQFLVEPLTTLSGLPATAARARGAAERVAAVLAADPLLPATTSTSPGGEPGLRLRDVHHGPLVGLDLEARSAEVVAVFAADAADGDALASLLGGRIAPESYRGSVEVCGVELRSALGDTVRSRVVAAPHEAHLFSGSIRSTVTASAEIIDPTRLVQALRASGADQVVDVLEAGLEHHLVDRGHNLSGGQRQRLALARALYSCAPVLVLHEPTTAVDSLTEQRIADGVRAFRTSYDASRGATIVITGSPALLAVADRVAVLRYGRVAAEGTHRDLLENDPLYAQAVAR
ncbi:ABC transporter ATP-binding protein [Rathayibacter rathayi]|uniref:ABC transporter ATP-binding protein n=1 Tax=Rathayibacter rathayi TaxID=33887 RepID=A0ABD6W9H1_RATRA|nr:ABC transporter ATP-binding protein [Rathayibacter rathayi]PPF14734.1 ABC transporter ATP-binding protein [Rathayibacter rathayi]PPF80530.1 ABC transporter ATP-binding protein [Rathayibacter rathayi]PPG14192.1 ABC transporter ATP-binding protein [Rathayibacter rathayi]PPG44214.1 ABC transporter ATP-binding protein [Rathayibacter rathayi]PPH24415.1 ABC transporter ATP-binding protein [Rathayibacter rathayi]